MSSVFVVCCNFHATFSNLLLHTGKQCGPRSDCSLRSSLIWVHTVCKNDFENHKQMTKQTTIVVIGSLRVKGSIFLKNRHILSNNSQINWHTSVYSINTIRKSCIWQHVKFYLVSYFWNGSKMKWFFYRISELMLAIRYDKKNYFISRTRDKLNFTDCQVPHFMAVLIPYIN